MSVITNNLLLGDEGYFLTKSLRFRSSASAYLNRTPTTPTNNLKWTWSGWIKRGSINAAGGLFDAYLDGVNFSTIYFQADGTIQFYNILGGADSGFLTTPVYRDPSAWYHIVFIYDSANATAADRGIIYINGVRQTVTNPYGQIGLNEATYLNNSYASYIGRQVDSGYYFDGYMTEVNFIDGQALTPSSFGETSTSTGVWIPKKYTGTYGTNGFYLPFTDVATTSGSNAGLGKDFSGNGNYWTTNNISVTSGSTYDSMKDVPTLTDADTANYCTLNPLASRSVGTMQNGNLTWKKSDAAGDNYCCASSISIPSSGKWYWEVTVTDGSSGANCIGIIPSTSTTQQTANTIPGDFGITTNAFGYYSDGNKLNAGSSAAYGNSFTSGDVIAVAIDTTNGKIWWSKNGTWQASGDPAAGTNAAFTTLSGSYYAASSVRFNGNQHDYNFGQRPFTYTPPSGFVALNTFNLPTPTIGATASSQANKYFDIKTRTGADGATPVSGLAFQPDFVWVKGRNVAVDHALFDAVRGTAKTLYSSATNAEVSNDTYGYLSAFNSSGYSFTSGSTNIARVDSSSYTYVDWLWKANGSGSSNTAGSITSTVSANTTAGFSIVTYTSPNSTSNQTVGHGLGVKPSLIIVKNRDRGFNWDIYHSSLGYNSSLTFTTSATRSGAFGAEPTSTVFTAVYDYTHYSTDKYVAYCFAEVAGYSKFGSYTGNGSADGTFVYLGFRPAFVLTKRTDSTGNWYLWDNKRIISANGDAGLLYPDSSLAESDYNAAGIDLLSNGFKIRNSDASDNGSGGTFIYMAFAENPFKYANAR